MTKFCSALFLAATVAILSAPVSAQSDTAISGAIKRIEFAGIHWGQPESELRRELIRRGFAIALEMGDSPSFEEAVQTMANARRSGTTIRDPRRTKIIEATNGAEWVQVYVSPFPGGPRVTKARYEDRSGEGRVLATAKQKYSAAALLYVGRISGGNFCLQQDRPRCDDSVYGDFGPMMPYISASDDMMTLHPGKNGEATYDKLFEDAVKAKMGDRKLSL